MLKKYRLFLYILLALGYGCFVYLLVYQWTYKDLQENKLYDESALGNTISETEAESDELVDPAISINVNPATFYILESYEISKGRYTNEILPLPIELIGMNEEEIYGYYLSKNDMELVVFEDNILVVRRLYEKKDPIYEFMLVEEKNRVVVYRVSTGEIFANTDIRLQELPYGLRTEIQEGKYFTSESELYYFLESYSS